VTPVARSPVGKLAISASPLVPVVMSPVCPSPDQCAYGQAVGAELTAGGEAAADEDDLDDEEDEEDEGAGQP
jgi:hypothetical protein